MNNPDSFPASGNWPVFAMPVPGNDPKARVGKVMDLIRDNAQRPGAFRAEQTGDQATLYVYDVIGGWYGGVSAEVFNKELAAIKAKTIHLRINSPGGDVFEARAMVTALRDHGAEVIVHVDGLAASAASYLMLAGKRTLIADGAFVMIHNAWGLVIGNKHDMHATAELLDKIDASIVAEYKRKSKKDNDWGALMDAETWFSADEALQAGLVDEVVKPEKEEDEKAKQAHACAWNVSAYDKAPQCLRQPAPPAHVAEPAYNRAHMERRLQLLERTGA